MCSSVLRLVAALLASTPTLAAAHDLWLERDGDGLTLRRGHRGGELLAVEQAKLRSVRCLEKGGTRDVAPIAVFSGGKVELASRCEVASAFYDGGYWSLTPEGEVNRPKNQVGQAVRAWASRQFAKWVDSSAPGAAQAVLGDELELVAVSDLSRAHEGDKITVRVLSGGRPVADAVVAIDHKALGESDSAGEVRVKLRTGGVETISASLRRKVQTPEADAVVLEASLTFQVAR